MPRFLNPLLLLLCIPVALFAQNPGTPDASFGLNGIKDIPFLALNIFPQTDNSIFIRGFDSNQLDFYTFWKYQPDGSLDSTYGIDGKFITPAKNGDRIEFLNTNSFIHVTQKNIGLPDNSTDLKIGKMNADFELDTTWGLGGYASIDIGYNDGGWFASQLPDGKIVVFGATTQKNNPNYESTIFIARFTQNGMPDSTFGFKGWVRPYVPNEDNYRWQTPVGLLIRPDGKFLIGASINRMQPTQNSRFYFAQYMPEGYPDNSFGDDGIIFDNIGTQTSVLNDMMLDNQGRLIGVGIADYSLAALARYLPNGQPDNTFSGDGFFTNNFMNANTAVAQPDGKILVGGNEYNIERDQIRIMRLNENGSFDNSFSGDGKIIMNLIPNSSEQIFDLELQADGKILFSGLKNEVSENFLSRIYSGLVVATEEPFSPSVKSAKVQPSIVHQHTKINIVHPHLGLIDPTGLLIDATGQIRPIDLSDDHDGLNVSVQIPTQLMPGIYHILFECNKGEIVRASFVKM